jgi:hypothetical protein
MADYVVEVTTGATDLAVGTRTTTTMVVTSSSGVDVTLPQATTTQAGLLNATGKTRLDQLDADDSPTFAGLTVTGIATVDEVHGELTGSVFAHVRNDDSITLAKGTPVYCVGNVGNTDRMRVRSANAASLATMPAVGLIGDDLPAGEDGHIITHGKLNDVPTNTYTINATLYVASGGGLTATAPANRQPMGVVARVNSSTGMILVMGPGAVL